MNFFETVKQGIRNHFEKRQQEKEMMEKLQFEADMQRRQMFQEQFRKDSLEVARAQAMREAAEKSGLQKLRAMNRARNLSNDSNSPPGSFFEKLGEYTRKNVAKREDNLKKTAMMREEAKKLREQRMKDKIKDRQEKMARAKPFGKIR